MNGEEKQSKFLKMTECPELLTFSEKRKKKKKKCEMDNAK